MTWHNHQIPQISNQVVGNLCNSAGQGLVAAFNIFDDQLDRNELIDIIGTIPDIELSQSQLPGENFLHQVDPDYMKFQEQYHLQQEQLYRQRLQQSSTQQVRDNKFNETFLEFDFMQDLQYFLNEQSFFQGKQQFFSFGQSPSIEATPGAQSQPSC